MKDLYVNGKMVTQESLTQKRKAMMEKETESIHTLNGHPLTIGQAMTLRVAIESFASSLMSDGLGDDEYGRGMVKGYMARIEELREIIYKGGM